MSNRVPHLEDQLLGWQIRAMDAHCQTVADQIAAGHFDVLLSGTCRRFGAPRIGRHVTIPRVLYLQEPRRRLYEAPNVWALRHRAGSLTDFAHSCVDLLEVQRLRQRVREEIDNARAFDTLLVNSHFSAESVLRAYGLPSRVCYLGIRPELWALESPSPSRTVVGIGAVMPHKRVHFILSALAATAHPHPSLRWIGNSWDEHYLAYVTAQAAEMAIDFTVHLAVPQDTIRSILRTASLLAYAPRLEPFGYAPLECAAAGLPTVGVAEGGIRETIIDGVTGILVQDDATEMAVAIAKLIDDPVRTAALGSEARRRVLEQWTIDGAVDRLETELSRAAAP
jgi:glycosyltransferase involved in cell wall biosynthesis